MAGTRALWWGLALGALAGTAALDASPRSGVARRREALATAGASLTAAGVALSAGPALAKPLNLIPEVEVEYEGRTHKLKEYMGAKATLVVNVASYCALTPQYSDLQRLDATYRDQGLAILAFPSNEFGGQEPEPVKVVRENMKKRFNIDFPILDGPVFVNGGLRHPLYSAMFAYEPELSGYPTTIQWNFEKFLLGSDGEPIRRYRPGMRPTDFEEDIYNYINKGKLPVKRKTSLN
eukprot:CAMPEP_0198425544 /NCGR_PEP_ID=MMETSP1452-20131203/4636_1 /TAXON_ID=1181717 /ORGANISM="Synchroma pusillum, Strain CCMP3072" /LENGTH=235 /DNA_ID=CAMNT_0044145901 /DNA_START=1 /DNA_END=708 /DNA_ORIENTATION=-